MNQVILMPDDEIRRERIYVLLLTAFLLGAACGTLLCAGLYRTGNYTVAFSVQKCFGRTIFKHFLWLFSIALCSIHSCGVYLIPTVFLLKGLLISCRVTGLLLFTENVGLYEALILYVPDILFFLLLGSFIGERGLENALALLQHRPALHKKNLYVLVNRGTTLRLALIAVILLAETSLEVLLTPYLLQ